MKRNVLALLLALIAIAAIGIPAAIAKQTPSGQTASQPAMAPGYPPAVIRRDFKNSFPLTPGEKLEYDIRISKFPVYLSVGTLTLEYVGPLAAKPADPLLKGLNTEFTAAPDEQFRHLRATAVSKGLLLKLFGYTVNNRYEALVDNDTFSARLSLLEERVGKRQRVQSAIFDRSMQQVKYLTTDLTKPEAPPQAKQLPLQDGMMSLLSGLFFLRLQDYKEGQMMRIPVSDDQKNYEFEILVAKREKIKTECGSLDTIRLEPKIFGPDKFFRKKGEMFIWLTDNEQHVPVNLEARGEAGKISVKLIKKTCKILDFPQDEKDKNDEKKEEKE